MQLKFVSIETSEEWSCRQIFERDVRVHLHEGAEISDVSISARITANNKQPMTLAQQCATRKSMAPPREIEDLELFLWLSADQPGEQVVGLRRLERDA